jgi:hypothetical protein
LGVAGSLAGSLDGVTIEASTLGGVRGVIERANNVVKCRHKDLQGKRLP